MDSSLQYDYILKLIQQLPTELQQKLKEELEKGIPSSVKIPVAKRKAGAGKGFITYMAEDFDAPLDDMKEYM